MSTTPLDAWIIVDKLGTRLTSRGRSVLTAALGERPLEHESIVKHIRDYRNAYPSTMFTDIEIVQRLVAILSKRSAIA